MITNVVTTNNKDFTQLKRLQDPSLLNVLNDELPVEFQAMNTFCFPAHMQLPTFM